MKNLKAASVTELIEELNRRVATKSSRIDEAELSLEEVSRNVAKQGLQQWLREAESNESDEAKPCPRCGRLVGVNGRKRQRTLHGIHGVFTYRRNQHYCRHCSLSFYPLDAVVGAPEVGEGTQALAQRVIDFGMNAPYEEAAERFAMHYGRSISTYFIGCIVDRLPLPQYQGGESLRQQDRVTVQVDGCQLPMTHGWKEAKLGVVVAEANHCRGSDPDGIRGHITDAHYVATMGPVSAFEAHLGRVVPRRRNRAERLRGDPVAEVVFVADGAPWIWKMQERLYPEAIEILDWAHAVSHSVDCAKVLFDDDREMISLWKARIETLLAQGQVPRLLEELVACRASTLTLPQRKAINDLLRYYTTHCHRMNYAEHRAAGRVIGSGIVESSHRHVLQTRMKRAGQHWSEPGAEKMARLRAVYKTVGPKSLT